MNATVTLDVLTAPQGVTLLDDVETVIATITPPTLEPVEEEIETETALVGEDGEPIEGATRASGRGRRGGRAGCRLGRELKLFSSTPVDWLIVGLGNPGPGYADSPHNVGFRVAEALARRWDLPKAKKKFAGELTEGRTGPGGPRVAILRPQTFMNESGRSVGPARGSFKLDLDHLVVVHDEIDLPFGDVRVRLGGGLAGHNGLKSLRRDLGAPDFHRVRVGVGRPDSTDPDIVAAYVLGKWRQPAAEVDALVDARRRRGRAPRSVTTRPVTLRVGRWATRGPTRSCSPRSAASRRRSASSTAATSGRCSATSCAAPATPSWPPTCAPRRSRPRSTGSAASTPRAARRSRGCTASPVACSGTPPTGASSRTARVAASAWRRSS